MLRWGASEGRGGRGSGARSAGEGAGEWGGAGGERSGLAEGGAIVIIIYYHKNIFKIFVI